MERCVHGQKGILTGGYGEIEETKPMTQPEEDSYKRLIWKRLRGMVMRFKNFLRRLRNVKVKAKIPTAGL
jgi:hypothetical protein